MDIGDHLVTGVSSKQQGELHHFGDTHNVRFITYQMTAKVKVLHWIPQNRDRTVTEQGHFFLFNSCKAPHPHNDTLHVSV